MHLLIFSTELQNQTTVVADGQFCRVEVVEKSLVQLPSTYYNDTLKPKQIL